MCIHCGAPGDVTREDVEREVAEAVDEEEPGESTEDEAETTAV
jgi:hypothetical protein